MRRTAQVTVHPRWMLIIELAHCDPQLLARHPFTIVTDRVLALGFVDLDAP